MMTTNQESTLFATLEPHSSTWGAWGSFDAVILAAGTFPTHPIPLAVLNSAKFVCCCDSAAVEYISRGGKPDAIVGDGDSIPQELKQRYSDIWHQVDEQADNDLTKATRFCAALGHKKIAYVGATGRREDHTLGNISLMARYPHDYGVQPTMFTDNGFFKSAHDHISIATQQGLQVSVFNLSAKRISAKGLKWPTYAFTEWWQGTLNEATGRTVQIECDGDVVVFVTYDVK